MTVESDHRVLVLMPTEKDAERSAQMLRAAGISVTVCRSVDDLCHEIEAGAAAALLTEEGLDTDQNGCLAQAIQAQPPWSDFPLVVLARGERPGHPMRDFINATFVERPVRVRSLVSVLRAALRSRRHQYAVRDHLAEKARASVEHVNLANALQLALDTAALGTWEWEPASDRMILSEKAGEIYGIDHRGEYRREELRLLLHPDSRDKARREAARAVAERSDYEIEYQLVSPGRVSAWVAARGRGVYDDSGKLTKMLGVVQDITGRKLVEGALRASEGRHRFLAELAGATQTLIDPAEMLASTARMLAEHLSVDRCAYADVEDEAFFDIVGDYSKGCPTIVGRWPVAAFGSECVRFMLANEPYVVDDVDQDARVVPHDLAAYRATTIRAVICVPLHKNGRFSAAMAVHQTQPRRWKRDEIELVTTVVARCWEALARMRTLEELKVADRKKDDFIALLAHELRNPLAPLRNGLQILKLAHPAAEVAEDARRMMDRQLSHMVRLIDDLLDVSRISRNKMELRRERVMLGEIVNSAVETAKPAIEAGEHELHISLPQRPVYLNADLTRLAQVFSNLLTNSAKYMKRRGRIWLSAERDGENVVVSVRDAGIGIPPESLSNIFGMFSQIDRSIERSTGGIGIGLALVKGLVEMHGGTVVAESDGLDQGSTFKVVLPTAPDEHQQPSPDADDNNGIVRGRRVLVVDDNRDGANSLSLMLKLLNNEVSTANDGVEAIEAARTFQPDVILMDVGMPRLNGYEATRQIRQHPWGKAIRIVALTGWGQEQDRSLSRQAGCDGHLVKPVNLSDLQRLLAELAETDESP